MSRILVIYGTTEGQTAKIGRFMGETLRAGGISTDVIEARTASPSPDDYDAVIVAASLHAGGYQRAVRRWVHANAQALNKMPTAFVSVCLAVLQHDPKVTQEITDIAERFFNATGWRPGIRKFVAGALRYSRYNWFKRWAMVRIVRKAGGDVDTSHDYEYTGWADLRIFAEEFARPLASRAAPAA
jgi:menaquinone-dependent protoporphyrinogen oxidase